GGNICYVKPRIKLTDNWGWCSEGIDGASCPTGVCVNKNKEKNPATLTFPCKTNNDCIGKSPSYGICADSWWESPGQIIVHEPGT
ncbi:MAG: hypothetical protein PHO56_04530, partial [Patescibacteria group bacterium]|nr:hypothetical protein [Patescibacteria group bacterium]